MKERIYWLGFSAFSGIGPSRFQLLLRHFGSAKAAWEASGEDYKNLVGTALATRFDTFRQSFSLSGYAKKFADKDVDYVLYIDKSFPLQLKELKNCPFILYVRGDISVLSQQSIAVVGTRKITQYGIKVTEMITQELVSAGLTITSGLAMGVDAVAHQTTLDAGGKTIAVLGCGVDCCSPRENTNLYNNIIASGGAVISEVPLGEPPNKGLFPARNRIVAGLSSGIVVTEGAEASGALITAEVGLQIGRKVFAVPGPITSTLSKGPYKLIAKGAKLVTSGEDIMKGLGRYRGDKRDKGDRREWRETEDEERILQMLEQEPLHFDEIVRRVGKPSASVGTLLSFMELNGKIINTNGLFAIAA